MTDIDTTTPHRSREEDAPAVDQPPTKRLKLDNPQVPTTSDAVKAPLLPPSHALLGITRDEEPDGDGFTQMLETDVGISEYVGRDIPPIQAVIKQRCSYHIIQHVVELTLYPRFTDFLVFEIDQHDRVIHLKSLDPPEPSSTPSAPNDDPPQGSTASAFQPQVTPPSEPAQALEASEGVSTPTEVQEGYVWSEGFTAVLEKFLSPSVMDKLKQMYEEGPEPPFVSDSGWGGRQQKQEESEAFGEPPAETASKRGQGRGRDGRGRDRGGRAGKKEDNRRVFTEVCALSPYVHITKRST